MDYKKKYESLRYQFNTYKKEHGIRMHRVRQLEVENKDLASKAQLFEQKAKHYAVNRFCDCKSTYSFYAILFGISLIGIVGAMIIYFRNIL